MKYSPKVSRRLTTDPNRKTGKVRGMLCDSYNIDIGMLKESEELLDKANIYLK